MTDLKSELEMLVNYREDNLPSPAIQFMHIHARRALEVLEFDTSDLRARAVMCKADHFAQEPRGIYANTPNG